MNTVNLIGRIANEVELRYTKNGNPVSRISLAIDRPYSKERKEEEISKGNPTADFISIVLWGGKQAELIAEHTSKGKLIGVTGRLESGSYENEKGDKVYITEVIANSIDILEWNENE